jgi:hypothetical protein
MQPLLTTPLANGLIPLFTTQPRSGTTHQSLDNLSEEQIRLIESGTREGLQEQLRILQTVNSHIVDLIGILTQTISAIPSGVNNNTNARTRSTFDDVERSGAAEERVIDRKGKGKEVVKEEHDSSFVTGGVNASIQKS